MEYIRDRKSTVPFSLHDSRITQIDVNDDRLVLKFDRIFQYTDDEEKWFPGIIEFTKTDMEECEIMVFDTPYGFEGEKLFSGETLSFEEFKEKYPSAEFEIITEGYCGYDTTYRGYIWYKDEEPMVGIMTIFNLGNMIYRL